jgi:hypothetical protein
LAIKIAIAKYAQQKIQNDYECKRCKRDTNTNNIAPHIAHFIFEDDLRTTYDSDGMRQYAKEE